MGYLEGKVVAVTGAGRGIGRALMVSVETAAHRHAIDTVQVDFWSFNEEAQAFYRRLGFVPFSARWGKRP